MTTTTAYNLKESRDALATRLKDYEKEWQFHLAPLVDAIDKAGFCQVRPCRTGNGRWHDRRLVSLDAWQATLERFLQMSLRGICPLRNRLFHAANQKRNALQKQYNTICQKALEDYKAKNPEDKVVHGIYDGLVRVSYSADEKKELLRLGAAENDCVVLCQKYSHSIDQYRAKHEKSFEDAARWLVGSAVKTFRVRERLSANSVERELWKTMLKVYGRQALEDTSKAPDAFKCLDVAYEQLLARMQSSAEPRDSKVEGLENRHQSHLGRLAKHVEDDPLCALGARGMHSCDAIKKELLELGFTSHLHFDPHIHVFGYLTVQSIQLLEAVDDEHTFFENVDLKEICMDDELHRALISFEAVDSYSGYLTVRQSTPAAKDVFKAFKSKQLEKERQMQAKIKASAGDSKAVDQHETKYRNQVRALKQAKNKEQDKVLEDFNNKFYAENRLRHEQNKPFVIESKTTAGQWVLADNPSKVIETNVPSTTMPWGRVSTLACLSGWLGEDYNWRHVMPVDKWTPLQELLLQHFDAYDTQDLDYLGEMKKHQLWEYEYLNVKRKQKIERLTYKLKSGDKDMSPKSIKSEADVKAHVDLEFSVFEPIDRFLTAAAATATAAASTAFTASTTATTSVAVEQKQDRGGSGTRGRGGSQGRGRGRGRGVRRGSTTHGDALKRGQTPSRGNRGHAHARGSGRRGAAPSSARTSQNTFDLLEVDV